MKPKPVPIIDTLFPGRRVHEVGGPSGSGKTTWLMQLIETWRQGLPVYGYASHPGEFLYLSYDRGRDDFIDTCERLKIDPSTYWFVSPSSTDMKIPMTEYLRALYRENPFTLTIIEGMAIMTPEGKINDQRVVGRWLRALQELCEELNFTIIGVLHSAKTKERDRYQEPRARIAGCGAWAGYASTVAIIEERDADGASELRDLIIMPRNAKKHRYVLDFKDGLLEEVKKESILPKFVQWLISLLPGTEFTITDARQATQLSESKIYANLERYQKEPARMIEKVSHGVYRVLDRNKC